MPKSVAAFIQAQQATSKKNAEAPFHFFHHKRLISPNKVRVESKILPQKLGIFQEIIAIPPNTPFNSDSGPKTNGGNIEVQNGSPDDIGKTLTLAGQQHARA